MKLLFIAPSNSIHSKKWIEYFLPKHEIYLISFYKKTIEINHRVNYLELTSLFSLFKNFNTLTYYISNADLVHQHYLGKFSWLMIFIKRPLILSPWGSDIKFVNKTSLKGILINRLFKKAKLITIDAEYMSDHVTKFGNLNQKIQRINFGTDTSFFAYRECSEKKLNDVFKIISLRNLEKIYCIEDLVESINLIPTKYKDRINVDIYGGGSEKENLVGLVKKHSLSDIIHFKGRFKYDILPKILNQYDLYISTSSSDAGLAASTSEAMSSGTLVLSSDNSENKYWINGRGLLYKTNDIEELSQKIIDSINLSNVERKKLIEKARNKVVKENDYNGEMKKMEILYSSVCKR